MLGLGDLVEAYNLLKGLLELTEISKSNNKQIGQLKSCLLIFGKVVDDFDLNHTEKTKAIGPVLIELANAVFDASTFIKSYLKESEAANKSTYKKAEKILFSGGKAKEIAALFERLQRIATALGLDQTMVIKESVYNIEKAIGELRLLTDEDKLEFEKFRTDMEEMNNKSTDELKKVFSLQLESYAMLSEMRDGGCELLTRIDTNFETVIEGGNQVFDEVKNMNTNVASMKNMTEDILNILNTMNANKNQGEETKLTNKVAPNDANATAGIKNTNDANANAKANASSSIFTRPSVVTLEGHSNYVYSVIQLVDGRLCSGSHDDSIKIWDLSTGSCVKTLIGHRGPVHSVIQLSTGKVCSGSYDETIKIWDLTTGECVKTLKGHTRLVTSVIELSDKRICSGSEDKTIKIWNLTTGKYTMNLEGHNRTVHSVVQLSDGRLCSGSFDQTIKLWDITTTTTTTGKCVMTLLPEAFQSWEINTVIQLGDRRICSGSFGNYIKVWDHVTGRCVMTLNGHGKRVNSVIQLADGRICSGSDDKTIKIWDLSTGKCIVKTLEGHSDIVYSVTQLSDGRICSGSYDNSIKIWSL